MSSINLVIQFNHPDAVSNTVRYSRIDNTSTPVYTTLTGITTSPLIIEGIPNGQYRVGITPVYADSRVCTERLEDTPPCSGIVSFSAALSGGNIAVTYTINVDVPYFQININYPNGGTFSQQYVNAGTGTQNVTPPSGLYGDYTVTIQPVCDPDTGFLGANSAPAIVNVPAPSNSTFTNNDSTALAPISLTAYSSGSQLIFTSPSVAGSGGVVNFYLADGTYTALQFSYGSGSPATGSLTTGSGTYPGTLASGTITFSNVIVSGGIIVTVT